MDRLNLLITGIGGQGIIAASDIVSEAALASGLDVKKTDSMTIEGRVLHAHVGADDKGYLNAPTESIIGAMAALEKLRLEAAKKDKKSDVIEGEVLSVKEEEN